MATKTKSYIANGDSEFTVWADHYTSCLVQNPSAYYISEQESADLSALSKEWNDIYASYTAARDAAKAAQVAKQEMRERYEAYIRETVRRIQADSRVTDAARRSADVPVHKTTRTPVPAPATAPRGQVVATDRFEHTITVSDSATPTRRGKPTGAVGCEVYVCVADNVPVTPEAYRFVGVWTRTPERVTFEPQDGGRTAHYLFRWVGTRGETGPWSDPTSATIPAF